MVNIPLKHFSEFHTVKGYSKYSINRLGTIRDDYTGSFISNSVGNHGYLCCWLKSDDPNDTKLKQELVHRLVALTWLPPSNNPNKVEINHKDGNKQNNHISNLEWVTKVENAEHANKYLRYKNGEKLKCRTRNFETGEVLEHESLKAAANYLGFVSANVAQLTPKSFGKLLAGKYEVRVEGDSRPWFYENRKEKVLSRYRLIITYPDGKVKEYYNYLDIIKDFRLYNLEVKGFHGLFNELKKRYPDYNIVLEDAYDIDFGIPNRVPVEKKRDGNVFAIWNDKLIILNSLREAERLTGISRKKLARKLDTFEKIDGCIFLQDDLELYELYKLRDKFLDQPEENIPSIIERLSENSI